MGIESRRFGKVASAAVAAASTILAAVPGAKGGVTSPKVEDRIHTNAENAEIERALIEWLTLRKEVSRTKQATENPALKDRTKQKAEQAAKAALKKLSAFERGRYWAGVLLQIDAKFEGDKKLAQADELKETVVESVSSQLRDLFLTRDKLIKDHQERIPELLNDLEKENTREYARHTTEEAGLSLWQEDRKKLLTAFERMLFSLDDLLDGRANQEKYWTVLKENDYHTLKTDLANSLLADGLNTTHEDDVPWRALLQLDHLLREFRMRPETQQKEILLLDSSKPWPRVKPPREDFEKDEDDNKA